MRRRVATEQINASEYRRFPNETSLMNAIITHAKALGYLVFHDRLAQQSAPGFPDLTICGHGLLMFVECKGPRGTISDAQQRWIDALGDAGTIARFATTERPDDYDEIVSLLDDTYERRHRPN